MDEQAEDAHGSAAFELLQEPTSPLTSCVVSIVDARASTSDSYLGLDAEQNVPTSQDTNAATCIVWRQEVRQHAKLMWPIIVASLLEYIPNVMVTILVGHIDDGNTKLYVSAANLSQVISMITCLSLGFGMTSALDTLCSQAHGAGCHKSMGVYLQSGFIVVGLLFIPMFAINWYAEALLLLLGQSTHVAKLTGDFSRLAIFGMPFLLCYDLLRKLLTAQHIVQPMVVVAMLGDGITIGAGYVLTYHTAWGYRGAALARTMANVAMPMLLMGYVLFTRSYKTWWAGWDAKAAWRHAGMFFSLGFPGMLMSQMESWSFQLMALLAGLLPNGVVVISTHAVVSNISNTIYMIFYGTAVAGCVRIGNALGANMPTHARAVCTVTLTMVASSGALVALCVILCRFQLPKLLVNDAVTANRSANMLPLVAMFFIADGINCAMQAMFRGMGRQRVAVWSNAVGYYVVGVPLSVVFGFVCHWGLAGMWWGILLGTVTNIAVLGVVLCKSDWHKRADEAQARTKQ